MLGHLLLDHTLCFKIQTARIPCPARTLTNATTTGISLFCSAEASYTCCLHSCPNSNLESVSTTSHRFQTNLSRNKKRSSALETLETHTCLLQRVALVFLFFPPSLGAALPSAPCSAPQQMTRTPPTELIRSLAPRSFPRGRGTLRRHPLLRAWRSSCLGRRLWQQAVSPALTRSSSWINGACRQGSSVSPSST